MADKAYISKIQLPSGSEYHIKDSEAQELIKKLGSPMHFIGAATVTINDGENKDPVISGYNFANVANGDVITSGTKEFVWSNGKWIEFGDIGDLKAFAYVDEGEVTIKPEGNVSINNVVTNVSATEIDATPKGSIGEIEFTGAKTNVTGTAKFESNVTFGFTGTDTEVTVSGQTDGEITVSENSLSGNYTPSGSVAITTNDKEFVTNVTMPSITANFEGTEANATGSTTANTVTMNVDEEETLVITLGTGTVSINPIAIDGNITVNTGEATITKEKALTSASGNFTGNGVDIEFTGKNIELSGDVDIEGTVTSNINTVKINVDASGTAQGSVNTPTFTGETNKITPTLNVTTGTVTGTLDGTEKKYTVTPKTGE